MTTLSEQRCFNHENREAVARCPECRNFFCRECITEHDGRVICASCLKIESGPSEKPTTLARVVRPLLFLVAFGILWVFFFLVGRSLLSLPDSFHDGSVWTAASNDARTEDNL